MLMLRIIALLFVVLFTSCSAPTVKTTTIPPPGELAVVTKVTDGDTIHVRLANQREATVRYIGMDTPESTREKECYGKEATVVNQSLVMPYAVELSNTIYLEKDVSETEPHGEKRLLRYVYLPDGRMVNEVLVQMGYAEAKAYPPDVKFQQRLDAAQKIAMQQGKGMWSGCVVTAAPKPTTTADPSITTCPQGCTAMGATCRIKGNINSGKKIFHVAGQSDYDNVVMSTENGERWFCTEAEAVANGWRKAQR